MQCHWRFITIRIFELPTWRKAFVENRFTQFPSRGWWCPLFCTEIQVGWEELRSTVWALEAKPGCLWSRLQLVEGNWKSKMGQLDSIQQASSLLPWISANQWMLSNILSLLHLNCCSCDHASVYQVRVHGCSTLPPETNESQRSELGADRSQRYPTAQMNDRANYTTPDFTSKLVARTSSSTYIQVKMALLRGSMGFMSFFRSEEDFCCDAGHAFLPPAASSCFRQYFQTSLQVLVYILTSGIGHIAASALTFAFATGMVGALLAEVRATVQKNKQVDPLLQMDDWYTNWLSNMQTITVSGWHWNPFFGGGSGVHPETWENTWDIYVYIYSRRPAQTWQVT